jgi:hypothetical protein
VDDLNTTGWISAYQSHNSDPMLDLIAKITGSNTNPRYRRPPITPKHPRWHQLPGRD